MKPVETKPERLLNNRLFQLKQYQDLQPAREILDADLQDRRILSGLFHMGQAICFTRGFDALAFTQITKQTFEHFGFSRYFTNAIYMGHEHTGQFHDSLILNPQIEVKPGTPYMAVVESCGSIDDCQTSMVIKRPQSVVLSGIVFHPRTGSIAVKNVPVEWLSAALLDHENVHLEGNSALAYPETICDIATFRNNWDPLNSLYAREHSTVTEHIHYVAREKRKNFLIIRNNTPVYLSPETVLKLYPGKEVR